MATKIDWVEWEGQTDFLARRQLGFDDVPLVLNYWYDDKNYSYCPVVLHADNSFSQYIESYSDYEMAGWLLRYTFSQGYIELPVWFNASSLWGPRIEEIRKIIEQDKAQG